MGDWMGHYNQEITFIHPFSTGNQSVPAASKLNRSRSILVFLSLLQARVLLPLLLLAFLITNPSI